MFKPHLHHPLPLRPRAPLVPGDADVTIRATVDMLEGSAMIVCVHEPSRPPAMRGSRPAPAPQPRVTAAGAAAIHHHRIGFIQGFASTVLLVLLLAAGKHLAAPLFPYVAGSVSQLASTARTVLKAL